LEAQTMMEEYNDGVVLRIKKREIVLWVLEIIQIVVVSLVFADRLWILLPLLLQTLIIVVLAKMLVQTERVLISTIDSIKKQQEKNNE
jgi:uncharacterized protein YqhQ